MGNGIIIFILALYAFNVQAQITFEENVISTNANGAKSIFAIDIDGDGDIDLVSASYNDNKIAWYENTDGQGAFSNEIIISTSAIGAASVFATDIDGDGDVDVISASLGDSTIAWYENIDGIGAFGSKKTISSNINYASYVIASDLDNDLDEDVIFISSTNRVSWFENTNSLGLFGIEQEISSVIDYVYATDVDNDGDNDIVYNSGGGSIIYWSENLGNGLFTDHLVSTRFSGNNSIHLNDINNDGNIDVVYSYQGKNIIAWSENTGLSGDSAFNHTNYNLIDTNIFDNSYFNLFALYSADLDNDGDIDVVNTICDSTITWYENIDGLGRFDTSKILVNNTNSIISYIRIADIDGDGDNDIITASYDNNKIAWYKNSLIDNISEIFQASFTIYPNPTKSTITIQTEFAITKIELYNNLGQLVLTKQNVKTINVSNLAKGVYNCKVFSKNASLGTEQIIIE